MNKNFKIGFIACSLVFLLSSNAYSQNNIKTSTDLINLVVKEYSLNNFSNVEKYILESLELAKTKEDFEKIQSLFGFIFSTTNNIELKNKYYQKLEDIVNKNISSPAFELLILTYENMKDYERILNLYRLKLLLSSENLNLEEKSIIFEKIGNYYSILNQFPLNIDNYKRAIELNYNNISAKENLAFNLLCTGEIVESENYYQQLIEYDKNNPKAILGLSIIIYIKGDAKKALEQIQSISNKDKDNSTLLLETIFNYELKKGNISNIFRYLGL